ncbi:MAG: hydrogenase maturation nickel metallochaperone HypA [Candidatus Omnitrophica bacterium]|nr:hydrogenase maturation nickel metallochaperone HypA [Candidatus Omnitrophota bacterium]MDE2231568.1 hydrogenase maturation nickel metallochaperone HypA [Candidatus Omnitrophota bacterium]
MHEGHFTENIVKAIIGELKKYPGRGVESVTVKVGETYHLLPDSVLMHYDLLAKGTELEGVRLELLEEPMLVACSQCGRQGPVEDHHLPLCSFCHSRLVKPVSGEKVTIEQIKFKP